MAGPCLLVWVAGAGAGAAAAGARALLLPPWAGSGHAAGPPLLVPCRLLVLTNDSGERVLVEYDDESRLAGIQTGMRIQVTGEWQREDGSWSCGSQAANPSARSKRCIRALNIVAGGQKPAAATLLARERCSSRARRGLTSTACC